ncbi:hypothetical protein QBC32DRAFT_331562 [Pseudoneurospora amorphoporcata]|uniref:Secreted protein n=1 Tax=Pseudoneurospora amorphoporcata TaxID=241081 RepID=A0AAN6P1S9_9PEZI|nr:hypothetical protein QBC32DRAFT_331562 [Pseudoneurospora amorphoporcata]
MKTQSILIALGSMLLAVQDVSAGCYTSGDKWPNKEEARRFVIDACNNQGGMFTGTYSKGQTKAMCPRSNGLGLLFEVQNLTPNEGQSDLNNAECTVRLENEINGCDRGGQSTISGWRFRADPGAC